MSPDVLAPRMFSTLVVNILALATTEQTHLSDKKVAEAPSTKVFEPENK